MEGRVKLSEAARLLGVSFRTAQRMAYDKRMPTLRSDTRRLFVPTMWLATQLGDVPTTGSRCAIYSRESSSENKAALLNQNGGGTVKKRNAGVIRDPFIGSVRVWGEVAEVF